MCLTSKVQRRRCVAAAATICYAATLLRMYICNTLYE